MQKSHYLKLNDINCIVDIIDKNSLDFGYIFSKVIFVSIIGRFGFDTYRKITN